MLQEALEAQGGSSSWGDLAGRQRLRERSITLTKFCSQRPRNCWNFWDISSWALPTALRTFPKTETEEEE